MSDRHSSRRDFLGTAAGLTTAVASVLADPPHAAAQSAGVKRGDLPDLTIKEVKVYVADVSGFRRLNSTETGEILRLLETIRRLGAKLIAITGSPHSTLAQAADVALDCSVAEEACPLNLVPTASTTAALALGDALAMTLLVDKGFRQDDFASLHPGGKLGKRLMRVEALMHGGAQCPIVRGNTRMRDVIYEMSSKGLGMTCVVGGEDEELLGIITDGDLRRRMERGGEILDLTAGEVMTRHPVTVPRSTLAAEALNILEQRKITSIVVAENGEPSRVAGVLHLHDLWRQKEMF